MTPKPNDAVIAKQNLSKKEMSERLQLSRSRLDQLIQTGVLAAPSVDERSGGPYFPPETVARNVEIRRTGTGANGKPALFYSPRLRRPASAARRLPQRPCGTGTLSSQYAELLSDLSSLGLVGVGEADVAVAVSELKRLGNPDPDTRDVFRHLKRRAASDS